jgi:hypothetical protein
MQRTYVSCVAALPILPTYVRSVSDFTSTVTLGSTPESTVLEFKGELPGGWRAPEKDVKRKAQKELCRDIAQFANTYGGCLLYGVKEQESAGSRVASSLNPITDFDGHREWLQQAIRNFLVPATLTLQIERIDVSGGCVISVNVPPSLHLVSVWDSQLGTIECMYRTNHGKEYMNPNEAERHLMNTSRAAALAFAEAVEDCGGMQGGLEVNIVSGVVVREHKTSIHAPELRLLEHSAKLQGLHPKQVLLGITVANEKCPLLNVPMGLVREVWPIKRGELGLMLDVKIVWDRATKNVSLSGER